ncbi:hypothetical protein [Brevundimonas sp.]|uniref:hypothetical protein n=1 Tax=Brevundimonas sp. TaxID=1871086 RepID=UPI002FC9AB97
MSRASEAALDALHGQVATILSEELDRALARSQADPENENKAVSSALLSQALKFLAQAGVTAPAASQRRESVASRLKEIGVDPSAEVIDIFKH